MIQSTTFDEQVHEALKQNVRGIVGVVDEVLALCHESNTLRLECQEDRCVVSRLGKMPEKPISVELPKSVFRALLARIAVLCNQTRPNSATAYAGAGEIAVPSHDSTSNRQCIVSFSNTPASQWLEIQIRSAAKPLH